VEYGPRLAEGVSPLTGAEKGLFSAEIPEMRTSGAKEAAEKVRTKSEFGKGWIGRG
jgi:hypothetical protein